MERINYRKKFNCFILLFCLTFTIFVFSSDAHRYSFDEDYAQQQTIRMVTLEPHPLYVDGKSSPTFEYPELFATDTTSIIHVCKNDILCSTAYIGHSATQVPFVGINNYFNFFKQNDFELNENDFNDPHYIFWRNSIDPNLTFLELFYGPIFTALSTSILFLICLTYNIKLKQSVLVSLIFAFATIAWAYSQTSFNIIPSSSFLLLGFLFYRKYQVNENTKNILLCSMFLGISFLIRPDAVLLIIPILFMLIFSIRKKEQKILKILQFVIPVSLSYLVFIIIDYVRFETIPIFGVAKPITVASQVVSSSTPLHISIVGLLFSPGIGMFVYSPILLSLVFTLPIFYKKYRNDCLIIISAFSLFLIYFGTQEAWHGLVAWGPRYLLPMIPFLLIPLAVSINGIKFKKKSTKILFSSGIIIGGFINFSYLIQDVSWFVWGIFGQDRGLYALGDASFPLRIHPAVLWTFEHSQLTHAISLMFTNLQLDIFLLKLLGLEFYFIILIFITSILSYLLIKNLTIKDEQQKKKM